jgi:ankyrin repeat protein
MNDGPYQRGTDTAPPLAARFLLAGSAISMYGDVAAAADGDAAVDASSAVARKPGMLASLPGRGQVHVASAAGDLHRLKALVGEGASVNTEDKNGRTPLMYALRFDELRTAEWLVANGATVDHQTKDRSTALHYACFQGTSETVQFLTKTANANHRLVDNEGRTPLHWSMHNCSVKIFDALVANTDLNEADLNTRDSSGMTAVMWACCYDATEHLDRLLALGADLHLVDVDGKSAMHWSVRTRRTKCLKRLLSYQNSFDMDAQGRSIIHHAAEIGNVRAIKLIATKRPQAIHDVDDNGRSPLHWAAVCRHTAVLRLLVKLGAYVSRKDVKGKTALQYTIDHEFPEGEEILRAEKFTADKPRLGPADASTSLRAFDMPVPAGFVTPSIDARRLFKMLRVGTYLSKCTNEGKGVLHRRYFWLDCFTGELCWCKSPESFARKPGSASSEYIVDVADGPSDRIRARADFDGAGAHKWALTLHTNSRMIDVVARDVTNPDGTVTPAEQIYRTWIDGLRCLKVYGEHILQAQTEELTLSDSDSDFDADDVDATIASMPAAEDM